MMRRRDATTRTGYHTQRRRRRQATCLGLSLGLHAGALALAAITVLNNGQAARLIRVSLAPGGASSGSGEAPAQPVAGSSAAVPAPAQPAPQALPAAPEPGQRLANRPPGQARERVSAHQRRQLRSAPSGPVSDTGSGATGPGATGSDLAEPAAGAGGNGIGKGLGSGAGDGADQRPACVYCPEPHYPLLARTRGWQGSVDVGLVVLADGSVDTASLRHSSGYGVLDQAAVAVARRSRFRPPSAAGLSAPLHGRIEYRFELTAVR